MNEKPREYQFTKTIFLRCNEWGKATIDIKGKGSETVKPNQNESVSNTKLFGPNFM